MNRLVTFVLLLFFFVFFACSKKADDQAGKESGSQSTASEQSAEQAEIETRINQQEKTLAPVVCHTRAGQHLAAGICYQYQGEDYIAFLVPDTASLRSVYAFLSSREGDDGNWRPCSIIVVNPEKKLCVAKLPKRHGRELVDLNELDALPGSLNYVYTAEWGDSLFDRSIVEERRRERAQRETEQHEQRMAELQGRLTEVEKEIIQLMRQRRRQRSDRSIMENIGRLQYEKQKLQRDIRQHHTLMNGGGRSSLSRNSGPPSRRASVVKKDIEVTRASSSGYRLSTDSEISNASVILSSTLIQKADQVNQEQDHSHESFPLSRISELHEINFSKYACYFSLRRNGQTSLHLSVKPTNVSLQRAQIKLFVAQKGGLPAQLEQTRYSKDLYMSHKKENCVAVMQLAPILLAKQQGDFDAVLAVKSGNSNEWQRKASFSFSLKKEGDVLLPEVIDAGDWVLETEGGYPFEAQYPDLASTKILKNYRGSSDIQQAKLAAKGAYMVIRDDTHLRVIETATMEQKTAVPWSENYHAYACDAEMLYLATDKGFHCYTLPQLSLIKEVSFPHPSQPLELATGSHVEASPLLCVYANKIQLFDNRKLSPLYVKIQKDKTDNMMPLSEYYFDSHIRDKKMLRAGVRSAPLGGCHSVELLYQIGSGTRLFKRSFHQHGGHWSTTLSIGGFPGMDHFLYSKDKAYPSVPPYHSIGTKIQPHCSISYPVLGKGFVALHMHGIPTIPAFPIMMSYFSVAGDIVPYRFVGAKSAARSLFQETKHYGYLKPFQRVYVVPEKQVLIAIGTRSITLEQLPVQEKNTVLEQTIVTAPPIARRGQVWSFPLRGWNGAFDQVKLDNGPEGATLEQNQYIEWKVPTNYPHREAVFTISTGVESPVETTVKVPIMGKPVAVYTAQGVDEKKIGISQIAEFAYVAGVDEILPIRGQGKVLIISDNGHRVSLLNLKTAKVEGSYRSSTGRVAVAVGNHVVYLWHLNGNLIEQCDLKSLETMNIRSTGLSSPLRALVGGDVPVAIMEGDNKVLDMYEINPNTLQISPRFVFKNFTTSMFSIGGETQDINRLSRSGDGTAFFIGSMLIRKQASQQYTSKRLQELASIRVRHGVYLSEDASQVITSEKVYDLATMSSWAVKNNGSNRYLTPDISGHYLVRLNKSNAQHEFELRIINFESRQSVGSISHLPELSHSYLYRNKTKADRYRIVLDPDTETLLTLSADNQRVILRKVPRSLLE